ncbi:diacylglycerol kinase family protein [uncultured Clostridium sp.]|uniref:diacylglycerol/lipid kinase family protein n=1 Tax=uncultured Clostridium sp. TaxID=59620 RepID=UPI0025E8D79B|nr:diacylglycerol kinase family protein [uncultured Clostridium sp.]
MKYLFIINPSAGKGKPLNYIEKIKKLFAGEEYYIELTKRKGHATEIVREYSVKEKYIIYAIGGDGTINEVVNGIIGTTSLLVIIPAGSGNDFIRSIYPNYKNREFLKKYNEEEINYVDVVKINNTHFINIASVGLDAEVVYNATRLKKSKYIKGDLSYILSLIKTTFKRKTINIIVKIDKKEVWNGEILLICMANGKYYGGGVKIMPVAKINDEKIDVCIIKNISIFEIIKIVPSLIKSTHLKEKAITTYKGCEISIKSTELLRVNIDGEIVEEKELNAKIIPKAIKLLI